MGRPQLEHHAFARIPPSPARAAIPRSRAVSERRNKTKNQLAHARLLEGVTDTWAGKGGIRAKHGTLIGASELENKKHERIRETERARDVYYGVFARKF